jgi:two-component system uhpT operon response regulator UhpA
MSLMAGVSGYLIKPVSVQELHRAIMTVSVGCPVLCAEAQKAIVHCLYGAGRHIGVKFLTSREQQIMVHMFRYPSDKELAEVLGISPGTVHVHLARLFKKLGVHTRQEALRAFLDLNGDNP